MDSWVSAATGVSSVMARFRQAVDRLTRHRASGLQAGVAARLLKYHNGTLPGAWQTAPEAWAPPYCAPPPPGGQGQNGLRSQWPWSMRLPTGRYWLPATKAKGIPACSLE